MTVHCKFQPDKVCDCVQTCVIVYYSVHEIRGYFSDYFGHGEHKHYEIKTYVWDEPTMKTHAIVRNKITDEVSEWAMNVVTRVPYWIRNVSTKPVIVSRKRPRKPGSAMWRATKAWEER